MSDRTQGIGGTDISAIVGLNPWRSPIDVYMEKVGLVDPQPDNEAMWIGRELEPAILRRYAKETGLPTFPNQEIMVGYEDWITGTPDAIVEPKGGVDAKTTSSKIWDDGVPDHVEIQAQWYCSITGAEWWDIALLILSPRREFKIFRIERDQEVIDNLVEAGRDFWFNHVLAKVPPPLDGSKGASEYLKKVYPQDKGDIIAATPEADSYISVITNAKAEIAKFEADKAFAENRLKSMIGDAAGLLGQGWRATWKKSKDQEVVDWEKLALHLLTGSLDQRQEMIQQYTTTKPGPRVFRVVELKDS